MLSQFPNARFAFETDRDGAVEFELVVRSLVDGLLASLGEDGTDRGRSRPAPPPGRPGRRTPERARGAAHTRSGR
jgi:hypothetical protein